MGEKGEKEGEKEEGEKEKEEEKEKKNPIPEEPFEPFFKKATLFKKNNKLAKKKNLLMFENQTQKARISLYFHLDSSGVVRLASADAVLYGMVNETVRKRVKKNQTTVNGTATNGTANDDM